jgi:MFS family permease
MSNIFKLKKDRSLAYLHAEGISSSVENAAIAYQTPSVLSAGADTKDIAYFNTITNLIFAMFLIKVPSVIKVGDTLKKAVIILSLISTLGWIPLVLVTLFFKGISPFVLITLWVVNLVPGLLTGPLVDKWLSDLVPSNRVGRYLSIRAIFSTAAYISFFYLMGYTLDHFNNYSISGFSLIFVVAFCASLTSLVLCFLLRVAVPFGESHVDNFGLITFIRESRQNNLGTFIVFTASIMFASSISTAFFSVYMLRDLHFSYLTYTLVFSVEYLARITISYFGGRWIDKAGALKVLRFAVMIIPVIPVLWLFSSNLGYLVMVQIISGIAWATFDLCTQSYLCRDSPQEKRLHYIVYHRSIVTFASAIGPVLGAFLLNFIYPVFGNPILSIFLVSGALRLVAVITILPRLKTSQEDPDSMPGNFEPNQVPGSASVEILPYNKVKLPRSTRLNPTRNSGPVSHKGSFYHPETWMESPGQDKPDIKQNLRQDLLYRNNRGTASRVKPSDSPEKVNRLKNRLADFV